MIDLIQNNPYRVLGVYSNSSQKEIVANQGRMKAFLNVGREVEFPLDLKGTLPPILRTAESVADAVSKLTLPAEQLRYAQFWFAKSTQFDDIAFAKLQNGDMPGALDVWSKKDNASSLQNRIVCALIKGSYGIAIQCAEKLYADFSNEFVVLVLGDNATVSADKLHEAFLDALIECYKPSQILSCITLPQWKEYVASQSTKPLIDSILSAIEAAKATKGKGCTARLNAGTKLMNDTKQTLSQLKSLLPTGDLQYQMIADKLGLEILQCGIDYYNKSEAADAAHKAMVLQEYANSIVVGQMAKDRCKENVDILKKIIKELPPKEVFAEDKAIKNELRKFCNLPDKICHAVTLLNNTKPYLQAIKSKLGSSNSYYLKISTQVVGNALHNLIEEVNAIQNDPTFKINLILDKLQALSDLQSVLREAWKATQIMDSFDMEYDFKKNRYNKQRSALRNLCNDTGVSTYVSSPKPTSSPKPIATPTPLSTPAPSSSSSDDTPWGCFIPIIIIILISILSHC